MGGFEILVHAHLLTGRCRGSFPTKSPIPGTRRIHLKVDQRGIGVDQVDPGVRDAAGGVGDARGDDDFTRRRAVTNGDTVGHDVGGGIGEVCGDGGEGKIVASKTDGWIGAINRFEHVGQHEKGVIRRQNDGRVRGVELAKGGLNHVGHGQVSVRAIIREIVGAIERAALVELDRAAASAGGAAAAGYCSPFALARGGVGRRPNSVARDVVAEEPQAGGGWDDHGVGRNPHPFHHVVAGGAGGTVWRGREDQCAGCSGSGVAAGGEGEMPAREVGAKGVGSVQFGVHGGTGGGINPQLRGVRAITRDNNISVGPDDISARIVCGPEVEEAGG